MELNEELSEKLKAGSIKVRVRTGAGASGLRGSMDGMFLVSLRSRPEKGAANLELLKLVSKMSGQRVEIVSGATSKTKILRAVQ